MQHTALRDVIRAVDSFEQRTQMDVVPQLENALLTKYVAILTTLLQGTGRAITYDPQTRVIALNGGTASRGYGQVESVHAESITDILKTKVLDTWGFNDAEQSAIRSVAAVIESGKHSGSGNIHTFTIPEHAFDYAAVTALQGTLDIVDSRVQETQRLKHAVLPLKEAIAALMSRLDIQRGIPSSKGLKDIPFAHIAHSDYTKIQEALSAQGVTGEHADLHLGLILIDLVDRSHEKVTFEKNDEASEEVDDEPQEIGEYRSVVDVETAAMRYTEHVHDIILQLEERSAVKTIGGFLVADLEREEHSVERLFDVVRKLLGEKEPEGELKEHYDAVVALVLAARDRTSSDKVRFAAARAGLITFRDSIVAAQKKSQEQIDAGMKKREILLRPITQLAQRIESTLAPHLQGNTQKQDRYTVKELTLLDEVQKILNELNSIRRGVYPDVGALEKKLEEEGLLDTPALTNHVQVMIEKVSQVFNAPRQRKEKAQKAFEHLTEGVLETTTYHCVRFERINNRITFHIPTAIATVVQDARLVEQIHSDTYESLAEAIRYANNALMVSTSQIVGLEERASESFVDDALARMERFARTRESVPTAYRSLRSKVHRYAAFILGTTFGLTVQIPEPPQREPVHDVDTKRAGDAAPVAQKDTTARRLIPADGTVGSTGGLTVTIPRVGTMPERTMRVDMPPPSIFVPRTVPEELRADMSQLKKVFSAPVSDHGTYTLLSLLRTYTAEKRTLTPDERKATDWFTHAFTRYINESPEERIAQLIPNARLPRGIVASTIPSKLQGVPVQIDYTTILSDAQFWKWFQTFYEKRKATSLAQPGLKGVAQSIDVLTEKLKRDFNVPR